MADDKQNIWMRMLIGQRPLFTFVRAILLAGVCVWIFRFVFIPVYVRGDSMLPTYRDGQFGFANSLAFRSQEPSFGDVVVIEMNGRRTMYLKRIVGLPRETVDFRNGNLFVNGEVVPEPYVVEPTDWTVPPETLGPREFYVVGDNRTMPWHAQTMGVVDRERIVGRIMF